MKKIKTEPYTDSIIYALEQTVTYFRLGGAKFFNESKAGVTIDQYSILDILYHNNEICQRELSQLTLKDRANATRILNLLEEGGFIIRVIATKEKRLIKKICITEKGKKVIEKNQDNLYEHFAETFQGLCQEDFDNLKRILDVIKSNLSKKIKIRV